MALGMRPSMPINRGCPFPVLDSGVTMFPRPFYPRGESRAAFWGFYTTPRSGSRIPCFLGSQGRLESVAAIGGRSYSSAEDLRPWRPLGAPLRPPYQKQVMTRAPRSTTWKGCKGHPIARFFASS